MAKRPVKKSPWGSTLGGGHTWQMIPPLDMRPLIRINVKITTTSGISIIEKPFRIHRDATESERLVNHINKNLSQFGEFAEITLVNVKNRPSKIVKLPVQESDVNFLLGIKKAP